MPVDYEKLLNYSIPEVRQERSARDTMLYALGVGLGHDPADSQQLQFVYEQGLRALPTMAVVMCTAHAWLRRPDTGLSGKSVAAEHGFTIHRRLPVEGCFVGRTRVTGIIDKGPGNAALVSTERNVYDEATGDLICTHRATSFCRGDGGFGGPTGPVKVAHSMPDRTPDLVCDLLIPPQAALIYRLSGDRNPLHADPAAARKAGFDRPILHGLCTMGVAGHALLKAACDYDPSRLKSMEVRFPAPAYPGELLRTEIWKDGSVLSFRSSAPDRDNQIVLGNGRAELTI